jgi:cytoskeletal protein CcmA (bactofilin family)
VDVAHVVVNGTVNGPVNARDSLELQGKARIVGDVAYRTLEMHVGAFVQGRLEPVEAAPGPASVVELKRAGTGRAGVPE